MTKTKDDKKVSLHLKPDSLGATDHSWVPYSALPPCVTKSLRIVWACGGLSLSKRRTGWLVGMGRVSLYRRFFLLLLCVC